MAAAVEASAGSSAESAKMVESGGKGSSKAPPGLSISTPKGAWSQVVRGSHPSNMEGENTSGAAAATVTSPQGGQESPGTGVEASSAATTPTKPVKQAWKKPTSPKDSPAGPVMGAVSWPALGDTAEQKSSLAATPEAQSDYQLPTSPTVTAAAADASKLKGKKLAAQSTPLNSETNSFVPSVERASKFNTEYSKPSAGGGGGLGTERVTPRTFHQQGNSGSYQGNRRNPREPRPNNNWNPQRNNYGYNRLGPRHYPPPQATYVNVNPGFPPTGAMYYLSPTAANPMHGPGFYAAPTPLVPVPDHASLRQMLVKQIEYYFSVENLCRDIFLRSNMDHQGFIPVSTIASFNRVRSLTSDTSIILDALRNSAVVEVQGDRLRKRHDGASWALPADNSHMVPTRYVYEAVATGAEEHTFQGVRNGDIEQIPNHAPKPKAGGLTNAFAGSSSANNMDQTFKMDEEFDHSDTYSHDDGEEDDSDVKDHDVQRLFIVTQKGKNIRSSESGQWKEGLPDDLAELINDGLYYYEQKLSKEEASVGSIPTAEANGKLRTSSRPGRQRLFPSKDRKHYAESPPSDSVGFFFGTTPADVQSVSASIATLSAASPPVGSIPKPFPRFQHPSHALLEDNGFKQQKYIKFFKRCMADRKRVGMGCSEEMNTLFRFWCYFLRTNFNRVMYKHFRSLAEEEFQAGFSYGMECLFRFYSYGLEQKFKQDLYEDFEQLTLQTYKQGSLYGLEKYWAFHFYREKSSKNASSGVETLSKHPELERLLSTEFRTLEDFQRAKGVAVPPPAPSVEKYGVVANANGW
ncbi:la-related protein 1A isoform X1 [Selaginella moellendorffii]|nr:la-related protein 1A isoform X1 [Selaginella moellendorffii]|eukprot:XP_024528779.1 la-related protein 1A isoform X1 [Selaginella moellendorffii]